MKIFIIGSAHPLRGGGISTFNERLCEVLTQQGHDVTIVSFKLQYPNILFPGKSQFTDEPAPEGVKILSIINSISPLNWLKVGRMLRREQADLIIVRYWLPFFGPCFGTILRQAKKHTCTKVISILDNVIPHESRIGDRAFTKYFLRPVDAFLTMSKDVRNDLKQFDQVKPVAYSPHPMYDNYGTAMDRNEALRLLKLNPDKKYILFFGFIRKYKGLDILLEALSQSELRNTDIELIVAGEYYGDEAYYQDLMAQLGILDKVHTFTHFISNDEVKLYFSASDLVVQPYRSATQSGISQIAYHFNKPMVVTHVGGLPEIVPHGQVGYVTEVTPQAIAQAIVKAFMPGQLEHFQKGIQQEKKKYEWNTFIDTIYNLKKNI